MAVAIVAFGCVQQAKVPGYAQRHSVRPGLTGLAQVYAGRHLRRAGKFRLDLLYLKAGGPCLDLKLLLLSFWITARGEWERPDRLVTKHRRGWL